MCRIAQPCAIPSHTHTYRTLLRSCEPPELRLFL